MIGQLYHGEPKILRMISYQGVNIFFLLSGIGLAYSLQKTSNGKSLLLWIKWFKKRFIRLSILYFTVLLFNLFIYINDLTSFFKVQVFLQENYLYDFLLHTFYLHVWTKEYYFSISPIFWFMGAVVFFYTLIPFFYNKKYITLLTIIVLIIFIMNTIFLINKQISISLMFFLSGVFISNYYHFIKDIKPSILSISIWAILLLFIIIFSIQFYFEKTMIINYLFFSIIFVLWLYITGHFLSNLHYKFNFLNHMLILFGSLSYPIYLVHWGLIKPIFNLFNNYYIATIIYISTILLISSLLKIYEKHLTKKLQN